MKKILLLSAILMVSIATTACLNNEANQEGQQPEQVEVEVTEEAAVPAPEEQNNQEEQNQEEQQNPEEQASAGEQSEPATTG